MALWTTALGGTPLSQITSLSYSSYRQSGGPFAVPIVFDVDYDVTDADTTTQGQMIYLPTYGDTSSSPQGTWVSWNARSTGRWGGALGGWMTQPAPPAVARFLSNPCFIWPFLGAPPCTWQDLLTNFPNIGVATHGRFGFEVGDSVAGKQWLGTFKGNVDKLQITINGVASTVDFELTGSVSSVPATAPSALPQFQDSDVIAGDTIFPDSIVGGAVMVEFYSGTSQALRQAAIDSIHGTVVGGRPIIDDDGFYYVGIPDKGAPSAVATALLKLDSMPQVEVAAPVRLLQDGEDAYLRPVDGHPDFRSWSLDPGQASGYNWGLERVRAPLAWGCSFGQSAARVGVVDEGLDTLGVGGFGVNTDLARNTVYLNASVGPNGVHSSARHGREVASVLAAYGNDGNGMTGMMWQAGLMLSDRHADYRDPAHVLPTIIPGRPISDLDAIQGHIVELGMSGADIINLSLQYPWGRVVALGHRPDSANAALVAGVRSYRDALSGALRRLAANGRHPLMVVAAGNFNLNALWSGFPAAKLDFPNQVMVVGASDSLNSRWRTDTINGSNRGSIVDVYAPGRDVGVNDGSAFGTNIVRATGTSLAAPMVAGVAGLLKSFSPALTSGDIKQLIVDGAQRHSIVVNDADGKYLLDAYEPLLGAAQAPHAGLCGEQQVWIQNQQVLVKRTPTSAPEVLGATASPAWDVDVLHGGHNVSYAMGFLPFTGNLHLGTFGWSAADVGDDPNAWIGSMWLSSRGAPHDANMSLLTSRAYGDGFEFSADSEQVAMIVRDSNDVDQTAIVRYKLGPYGPGLGGDSMPTKHIGWIARAFSRLGDSALVAVSRIRGSVETVGYSCTDDRGITDTCFYGRYSYQPDSTFLYSVNTVDVPHAHLLRILPDTIIYNMAFSEDQGSVVVTWGAEADTIGGPMSVNHKLWCKAERIGPRLTGTTSLTISDLGMCPDNDQFAPGLSLSPQRAGWRRPALAPRAAAPRRWTTFNGPPKKVMPPTILKR